MPRTLRQQASDVAPAKESAKKAPAKPAKHAAAQKGAKGGTEERANKKAEVIAMMKRAKGVTLAEIVEATGWQKHTVRGFVSILGSKGGEKIESSKNAAGERTYRIEAASIESPGLVGCVFNFAQGPCSYFVFTPFVAPPSDQQLLHARRELPMPARPPS